MPDYLNPSPPPTDPDEIAQAAFERIRVSFPNYDPRDSQMATIVIVALAFRAAEIADLIPLIPKSIFRWFGAKVIGLPPEDGEPASAAVTIFVRDDAGYTIEADTVLSIEDDQGDTHLFGTDADAVIEPGATSVSNVTATALEDGPQANGITAGAVAMVEALDYVINVTQQGTSAGGIDPEDDDDYVNRLSRRLGLIPRPVLADDFAALAMVTFPEIYRMGSLNHYGPGVNQVNNLNFVNVVGGSYTLTLGGQVTAPIFAFTTAAGVQTALEALAATNPGDVTVTDVDGNGGGGTGTFRIEHKGSFLYTTRTLTVNGASLTGGGTANITTPTAAVTPNPALAGVVSVAGIYEDGTGLLADLKAAVDTLLQANREWGFVVNVVDVTFWDFDATFTFTTHPNYNKADVEARAEQAIAQYVNPATFGSPPNDPRGWNIVKTIYHWEIVGVLQGVEGLDRLITLTLGFNGGAQSNTDKTMTGDFPLPRPGTIIGTAA